MRAALPQMDRVRPPPFRLPGLHFASALLWLLALAVLLPLIAPRLARGQVLDPLVFATAHTAVLGVMGSAIFGALYQFVPGGLDVALKSVRVGEIGLGLYQLGVLLLVVGFGAWTGWLQLTGWVLIFLGVGAVSYNVLPARRRSPHGKLVGLFITAAHSALGFAMAIGLARIGETMGWWHVDRLGLIAAHLQLGVIGFGSLTAIGVGSRMLPTFLVAQGRDDLRLRVILWLTSVALAGYAVGAVFGRSTITLIGGIGLLAAGALMLGQMGRWFRRRQRALDEPLRHVAVAAVFLALALAWGTWLVLGDGVQLRRWSAYLVFSVLGWLLMLVIGVMAKIVSHLSYIHLFARMPGFAAIGNPNLLLRSDWMRASWVTLGAGVLVLALGLEWGSVPAALAGAAGWSLGSLATVANYGRMVMVGRNPAVRPAAGRTSSMGTAP
jgi:hypothetical protein